ncbi:YceI family protein [Acetobacter sacchari]|uniref:YceI family protein n=1 Tax=Acetobacter sacchari TaxID=2661687 RepID=A0ABS3LW29_9PROT|nr:YceI family protein [Acetobacter sacchari]MBO1360131.1 YceI family protein [Acetobacter sacchari]
MKTRLMTSTVAALAAAAFISSARAETTAQGIQAGEYKVEPGHTEVTFSLLHFGFTQYSGMFSGASGSLKIDPAHLAATKLTVSLPISSVATTSDVLTGELKEPDWFDAARYPTATFTSKSVTATDAGHATISGDLTLHGVTKPVVLQAQFIGAGVNPMDKAYTIGFQATGVIKRSDFGVSKYVPMVGDDVTLSIAGAFEKQN